MFSPKHDGVNYNEASRDAEMVIYLNIKRFFSVRFESNDIESRILSYEFKEDELLISADFFWRLLFMRLNMKLAAAVSFRERRVHIPMIVSVPVEARNYLHRGSGSLYTWATDPKDVKFDFDPKHAPLFDLERTRNNREEHIKTGLQYCNDSDQCSYSMRGTSFGVPFVMEFVMPKQLVENGFFPQIVRDPASLKRGLRWYSNPRVGENRIGMYMELSDLTRGEFKWDFFIHVD